VSIELISLKTTVNKAFQLFKQWEKEWGKQKGFDMFSLVIFFPIVCTGNPTIVIHMSTENGG
jgi:hypothetical protein